MSQEGEEYRSRKLYYQDPAEHEERWVKKAKEKLQGVKFGVDSTAEWLLRVGLEKIHDAVGHFGKLFMQKKLSPVRRESQEEDEEAIAGQFGPRVTQREARKGTAASMMEEEPLGERFHNQSMLQVTKRSMERQADGGLDMLMVGSATKGAPGTARGGAQTTNLRQEVRGAVARADENGAATAVGGGGVPARPPARGLPRWYRACVRDRFARTL